MITLDEMVANLSKLSVEERLTLIEKVSTSIKSDMTAVNPNEAAANAVGETKNGHAPDAEYDEYRRIAEITGVDYAYVPTETELRQARLDYMKKRDHRVNNPAEAVPMTPHIWNGQPLSEEELAQLKVKLLARNYEPIERAILDARDFSNAPTEEELAAMLQIDPALVPQTKEEFREDRANYLMKKYGYIENDAEV
jgi:hypothetical protein